MPTTAKKKKTRSKSSAAVRATLAPYLEQLRSCLENLSPDQDPDLPAKIELTGRTLHLEPWERHQLSEAFRLGKLEQAGSGQVLAHSTALMAKCLTLNSTEE